MFMRSSIREFLIVTCVSASTVGTVCGADLQFTVDRNAHVVALTAGGLPLIRYVYQDLEIARPYFKDLMTPGGFQVSRHHPPRPGIDAEDHGLLHPGLWLAFGDLNGQDFWRLKAKVIHEKFLSEPVVEGQRAKFAVANWYEGTKDELICREQCHFEWLPRSNGWLLLWDSKLTGEGHELVFGDQEEMGLGVRVATPLAVKNGGEIRNSNGQRNEKECWGKPADWCQYSGKSGDGRRGVIVMAHPENFKRSSFHVRDYGFMAANPFAEKSFGRGTQPAKTVVKAGETLRLRFGVLVYSERSGQALEAASEYRNYVKESQ